MSRPYIPISRRESSTASASRSAGPSRVASPSLRYIKELATSAGSGGSGLAGSVGSDTDKTALLPARYPGYNTPDQPSSPRLPATNLAAGAPRGSITDKAEVPSIPSPTAEVTPRTSDRIEVPDGTGKPRRLSLSPHQEMSYTEEAGDEVDAEGEAERSGRPEGEAAGVLGHRSQTLLFIGIGLSAYIYSLDGLTSWQFLQYATSSVSEHSLSGTLGTAQAIIIAVGKPLMAKLADVIGRAETFIIVTILYVAGYSIIATANDISQIALGEITYAFGYTGLQILQQIVVADMTNLRWRGLMTGLVSAPFIINNFVSAELVQRILPDWRWGYGMFAFLLPVFLSPIIGSLLWAQNQVRRRKRNKLIRPHLQRKWSTRVADSAADMDVVGLLLIAASLSLFLLPLGLIRQSQRGLHNPSMLGMIALGLVLFPVFILYEARFPAKPVVPVKWFKRAPILGACAIGFLDFVSFYLQYTYLYPYVYVTRDWNYRELGYFTAVQSLTMTVFGIVGGALMWATHRFKYMLFLGLLIRLIGCLSMLHARSAIGTTTELVLCQILQGIGGGFSAISIQVSAQASVSHADVATITAMVLLISEIGNSVGSALSTGMWAFHMPLELERFVPNPPEPGGVFNETLIRDLYGSMTEIVRYEPGSAVRAGAEMAYHAVMQRLVIAAAIVAVLPPFFCLYFTKDVHLGRAQKARESAKLARSTRRSGVSSETSAVYDADVSRDVEHGDDDAVVDQEESRGLLHGGEEAERVDDPVPSYQDAIAHDPTASHQSSTRSKSMPIDSSVSGTIGTNAASGIPIAGMSMGVAVPAIAPLSPQNDYFSSRLTSRTDADPHGTHRHTRHPGDAGHSVWKNDTPHFSQLSHHTTNRADAHLDVDSAADAARWLAPSPAASPSGRRYAPRSLVGSRSLGMGAMGSGEDGDRGLWGSPTGDSPRRERNWARRAERGNGL